jgi:type IV pilus assembly protein PilM
VKVVAFNTSNIKSKLSSKSREKVEKPRDVIAFDIGSNTIKIVEGRYSKNKLQVYRMMDMPTPEGAVEDGRIINERELSEALKSFLKKNNVKIKEGTCTTNSSSIISREILIPIDVEVDEMDTVIEYEIEQYLPIKLDDYIVDYTIVDKVADTEGQKRKVNVVSFPKVIAKGYYELLNSLELTPYVLDVNFNALSKITSYSQITMGGTVAFVDMGATSINVTIFSGGKLDFTRIIKYGGDNIDYALSTKLDMSTKSTESEKIEKASLLRINEDDILNVTIEESILEILGELERILQFYNNQSSGSSIESLVIYGGTSNIEGIDQYIENKLNIPTKKISRLKNIEFTSTSRRQNNDENVGKYLNALGSIIRL